MANATDGAGRDNGTPQGASSLAIKGMFTPVLAKHTKNLRLVDILSVGVDRMQRNFEPMRKQVEALKGTRLPDETAKLAIYQAFVEGKLDAPRPGVPKFHLHSGAELPN